jgi:hypothetical protein
LHRYLVPTPLLIPPAKGGTERNTFSAELEKITILRWMSSSGSREWGAHSFSLAGAGVFFILLTGSTGNELTRNVFVEFTDQRR